MQLLCLRRSGYSALHKQETSFRARSGQPSEPSTWRAASSPPSFPWKPPSSFCYFGTLASFGFRVQRSSRCLFIGAADHVGLIWMLYDAGWRAAGHVGPAASVQVWQSWPGETGHVSLASALPTSRKQATFVSLERKDGGQSFGVLPSKSSDILTLYLTPPCC